MGIKTAEVELTRNNISPSAFFRAAKSAVEKAGLDIGMTYDDFKSKDERYHCNIHYHVIDGMIHYMGKHPQQPRPADPDYPLLGEVVKNTPYDHQTYIRGKDGSCYNQIIEFTFDSEFRGHGYFYMVNIDPDT